MTRELMIRDRLLMFVKASEELTAQLRRETFDLKTDYGQRLTMHRHEEVSILLQTASRAGIINVDLLKEHGSWIGESAKITPMSTARPTFTLQSSDGTMNVSDIQYHFSSAATHVKNIAGALIQEANGKQSKSIQSPYGQTEWLPVKLES